MADTEAKLRRTPLYALHCELGGKMVPFAGYELPVQYPAGVLAEHQHTRQAASLFDVSHMGQVRIDGAERVAALESLVPCDVAGLAPGAIRYSVFTNASGGILDDLMITNAGDFLFLVVNGACKENDIAHLKAGLAGKATVTELDDLALMALQGPKAAEVMARFQPACTAMNFMTVGSADIDGVTCQISRSGYTGEDGYEISVPAATAEKVARRLLAEAEVEPAGLGARDSLRLEAGLCLYGHDIDETTTPIEAGIAWSIQKRRREEGGFPGADVIQKQLAEGPPRRRVGIQMQGRAPAREGTELTDMDGRVIGVITSGGFGPSADRPVAMGYVETAHAKAGTELQAMVRGTARPCGVVKLPFVAHNYYRG